MRLCSRRRNILRNLLFALLGFSLCLIILSYYQQTVLDSETKSQPFRHVVSVKSRLLNRDILNFFNQNASDELQKVEGTVIDR